ncbi:hypothetical protein [Bdellovibrio svalbardensis]|uniref:Uncharacterized protein n=1 Tax=Bdellovibrio svalbardensis TaxID=2972972 RepID=A0ABT6DK25_9BACT|nr:hypothetical protein [Bdellovibrio svalbardensis]MDG0817223.1 hypothetical protein [Bdellovibrio svalbardensis]
MRKIILGLLLTSTVAVADTKSNSENAVMTQMLEQVLNSVEQSAVDLNIDGISIDSEAKQVTTDSVRLSGMISFGSDWQVELVPPSSDEKANDSLKKINPKLLADAKDLKLAVDLKMLANSVTIDARFFSRYDSKAKKWIARPLTLKVANQMNMALMTIRMHSLKAVKKANDKNPNIQDISGTCESDKILLDLTTGQNKQVPVDCRFSGTMTEKGYKIHFKYANQ